MGFLLFAARKLQLKREINTKQYELTVLTSQYNDAQKRVKDFQEQMNNMKNMTSVFAQGIQSNGSVSAYRALLTQPDEKVPAEVKAAVQRMLSGDMSALNGLTNEQRQALSQVGQMGSQAGSSLATAFTNVSNSIFDAVNKVELAKLTAQENSLELRKGSLESELSLLNGEYDAVKGQEAEAVKEAVPHFGLA